MKILKAADVKQMDVIFFYRDSHLVEHVDDEKVYFDEYETGIYDLQHMLNTGLVTAHRLSKEDYLKWVAQELRRKVYEQV